LPFNFEIFDIIHTNTARLLCVKDTMRVLAVLVTLAACAGRVAAGDVETDAHAARGKAGPRFGTDHASFFNGGENLLAWDENVLGEVGKGGAGGGAGGKGGETHLQKLRRTEAERQLYLHAGEYIRVRVSVTTAFPSIHNKNHVLSLSQN
jgi:hypothetical protein